MPELIITSPSNPRVKKWVALGKRSERDASLRFMVEGRREVARIRPHVAVVEIIWCGAYAGDDPPDGATNVSREVFDRLSRRQHPDGVAAVCETPTLTLDRFHPSEPALVLVGDGIEKPGNIGAMIRTCDALGAAFLGSSLATDIVNPNVIRASQGSLFATPTASAARSDVIEWCRTNTSVFVTSPDEGMRLWDIDLTGAVSIVIGAEDDGVDPDWLGVGRGLAIPMRGAADSLNASVSAAIVLAEAARQRSD